MLRMTTVSILRLLMASFSASPEPAKKLNQLKFYLIPERWYGLIDNRLDRLVRTRTLLEGPELPFGEWYEYYRKHDLTILLTKREHKTEKFGKLYEIPEDLNLFHASGFGFKKRKSVECIWMKKVLNENR